MFDRRPRGPEERGGDTRSITQSRKASEASEDYPLALRVWKRGPYIRLDDYTGVASRRLVSIGRHPGCDVSLHWDDTVTKRHAVLLQEVHSGATSLDDTGSHNGTELNGVLVTRLREIHPGDVIKVGNTLLLVCGKDGRSQEPTISGKTMDEILSRGVEVHGSWRQLSEALRMSRRTLGRWFKAAKEPA